MTRDEFDKAKKVHFIGIGGIGISAVARMMLLQGKDVSGSDRSRSEITDEVVRLGARFFTGHSETNLPDDADLVVYTIAVTPDNPELSKAVRLGIPTLTYPETLSFISSGKKTIAVSGTHGKTTTTAMIAKILSDAKLDPTVIVGSLIRGGGGAKGATNFIGGKGEYFVVEACEYRRSFLNINPTVAVITNIDNDHLDYYKDISEIERAFAEFAAKLPKDGLLVVDKNDPRLSGPVAAASCRVSDYSAFMEDARKLDLKVPGEHNRKNAAAALAVADHIGVPKGVSAAALEDFRGAWRRFEYKGKGKGGALVYDDYGHHPTEIKATILGAREMYEGRPITAVFQPHLYSRTRALLDDFGAAFGGADKVIVLPIYAAREPKDPAINSQMLVEKIKNNGIDAEYAADLREAADMAERSARHGVIITIGAGDIHDLSAMLVSDTGEISIG